MLKKDGIVVVPFSVTFMVYHRYLYHIKYFHRLDFWKSCIILRPLFLNPVHLNETQFCIISDLYCAVSGQSGFRAQFILNAIRLSFLNYCLFHCVQFDFSYKFATILSSQKPYIDDKYHAIKVLNLYKNTLQFNTCLLQIKIHI